MAKNYIQDGNTVRLTTTKAVTSGDVIVTEDLIAIAVTDAAKNEAVVGLTTGVFSVKAKQADDIKQGAVLVGSRRGNDHGWLKQTLRHCLESLRHIICNS